MAAISQLLVVQEHDTSLDQLRHRRATLPERDELERLGAERDAALAAVAPQREQRDALVRDQKRLDDETAGVEDKAGQVDRQLYGGGITSPKEAQALQADLESLKRRQRELEDQVLEIMEQLEPLDAELAAADARVAELAARRDEVTAALTAAEADLDRQLASVEAERAAAAAVVDDGLLATYDRLRTGLGGVAVARLQGSTCQGCHLTLSPGEVDQMRREPPDAIVHCPECQRILVR